MPYKSYAARIASGLARGLSRSQAAGHPKASELPATIQSLVNKNPIAHSIAARAAQLGNPTAIASVKRAYQATHNTLHAQNPLVEQAVRDVQAASTGSLPTSFKGTGRLKGLYPNGETVTIHVAIDKMETYLQGKERYKVFDSRGNIRGRNLSLDDALEEAEQYDSDYDADDDDYRDW